MPKFVLALDTSQEVISLGLARYTGQAFEDAAFFDERAPLEMCIEVVVPAFREANTQLLTQIDQLLTMQGVSASDIAAVVVGRGPGSFTGVRIALATAKGLAFAWRVPLYGVSTSVACGYSLQIKGERGWTLLISDALRKEIYPSLMFFGDSKSNPAVTRLDDDFVCKPLDYLTKLEAQIRENEVTRISVVGSGLAKYGAPILTKLEELGVEIHLRDKADSYAGGAGLIAAYAHGESAAYASGDVGALVPIYTRMSDAEEAERIKAAAKAELDGVSAQAENSEQAVLEADLKVALRPTRFMRLLNPSDLQAMAGLALACESIWEHKHFIGEFDTSGRRWFGIFEDSTLIAQLGSAVLGDELHILDIMVAPEYRRQGLAQMLMARAEHEALESRCRLMLLEVRSSNAQATELYLKSGFEFIAERPNYYPDGEDAQVMMRELLSEEEASLLWAHEARAARAVDGPRILALESSCDETAMAIIEAGEIRANIVASQIEFHARFGGVVPEIASRKHTEALVSVSETALAEAKLPLSAIDALAVTDSPGLIGALVVGLAYAKGLSYASGIKLFGINHLEAHLYANILSNPGIEHPFVALVISGGHTSLIASREKNRYTTLGATLDDAAGEAFDKVAKALGLPYPGGPHISRLAREGNPAAIDFPRAMLHSKDYSFSFSGLKTAVLMHIQKEERAGRELNLPDIAASFQQAVIDVQVAKALSAMEEVGAKWFLLAGGVAANEELRSALESALTAKGYGFSVPAFSYCTDNAAMVAATASDRIALDRPLGLDAEAKASAPLDTL